MAFLGSGVGFCIAGEVISEGKEIFLPSKTDRVDWANQVCMSKLEGSFGSLLWLLSIVNLGRFGPLATITDVA